MANQFNFENSAKLNMKSTQAEAAMGRMSKQATHKEPGIIDQVMTKLAIRLIAFGKSILALFDKEAVLNS